MNLRLPIVVGVVAVAAAAAIVRGGHPAARPAPLAIVTAAPAAGLRPPAPAIYGRSVAAQRRIVVYVVGNVVHGGVFALPAAARAIDALHAAGGATSGADMIAVNLAKPLVDGEELVFPAIGTRRAAVSRSRGRSFTAPAQPRKHGTKRHRKRRSPTPGDTTSDTGPDQVIDLNTADESALETLPGVGSALAERIALVRQQSGPFASLDDLLDVSGMTQNKLDAITPYVTLH